MSSVILTGDTSGTLTVSAPLVAGSNTVTLPAATGTISLLAQATAVASTSGTSIDFTGIPSWAKRITVMFQGVSTNGSSQIQVQIGSGSVTTTGYLGAAFVTTNNANNSSGFLIGGTGSATDVRHGIATITLLGSNAYVFSFVGGYSNGAYTAYAGGSLGLSGALDRVRITTVNGTDTFDAGSINVMWEG